MPDLHPENEIIWEVFSYIRSQVLTSGMGGFAGFDFSLVPTVLTALQVPLYQWVDVLDGLNSINLVAQRVMREEEASDQRPPGK